MNATFDRMQAAYDAAEPDEEQPECQCGALLPWEPTVTRRQVGYPDEKPFTEVRLSRTCPECGDKHDNGGWYED